MSKYLNIELLKYILFAELVHDSIDSILHNFFNDVALSPLSGHAEMSLRLRFRLLERESIMHSLSKHRAHAMHFPRCRRVLQSFYSRLKCVIHTEALGSCRTRKCILLFVLDIVVIAIPISRRRR